jgi:hypothetical protein
MRQDAIRLDEVHRNQSSDQNVKESLSQQVELLDVAPE